MPRIKHIIWPLLLLCQLSLLAQQVDSLNKVSPVQLQGSLSVGSFVYHSTRENNPLQPFGYSLNANAQLRIHKWYIPISAALNQQGSSLSTPFNRIGVSPTYKSLRLHLGHTNLNWSPFLLNGATVLGAGAEWTPKSIRMGILHGRLLNRPRFIGNGPQLPTYRRNFRAYKVGLGTDQSYLDFMLVKGRDDISSLSEEPDSVLAAIPAQENVGIGMDSRFSFAKDRLVLKTDLALSIFTEDLRFDTLRVENNDFARWVLDNVIPANASSNATYAGEAELQWRSRNFSLAGTYRRVMPEFQSFGANYLLTDLEAITLNPSWQLLDGKLILGGSLGVQYNNLDDRLLAKTKRNIGGLDINLIPAPHWGVALQYSNFSFNQQVLLDSLRQDSFVIDQINNNITLAPHYSIIRDDLQQHFFLNLNYQGFRDEAVFNELSTDNDLFLANLNYMLYMTPLRTSITAGVNYLRFSSETINQKQFGLQIGARKALLDDKLKLSMNGQWVKSRNEQFMANNLMLRFGCSYRTSKMSTLTLNSFWQSSDNLIGQYTDLRAQISYRWRW